MFSTCVVLSVRNQFEISASLANADASYQCHYSILAFTVSVVLMSMDPYRHRSVGEARPENIFKNFIADQTPIYNLCPIRAESCV